MKSLHNLRQQHNERLESYYHCSTVTMNTAKLLKENYDLHKGIILEEMRLYPIRLDT